MRLLSLVALFSLAIATVMACSCVELTERYVCDANHDASVVLRGVLYVNSEPTPGTEPSPCDRTMTLTVQEVIKNNVEGLTIDMQETILLQSSSLDSCDSGSFHANSGGPVIIFSNGFSQYGSAGSTASAQCLASIESGCSSEMGDLSGSMVHLANMISPDAYVTGLKEASNAVCDNICEPFLNVRSEAYGCTTCECTTECDNEVMCALYCPAGFKEDPTTGCPTCSCNECPAVRCEIQCAHGHALNADGCPTCECLAECSQVACSLNTPCQYGYAKDNNGCPTCECADPTACTDIYCIQMECPPGTTGVQHSGECCPSCVPVDPLPCGSTDPSGANSGGTATDGQFACPTGQELFLNENGCPVCKEPVVCDNLQTFAECDPACKETEDRVLSSDGCCYQCVPAVDCSLVRCAMPACTENQFHCKASPDSCCETCCDHPECSNVDCALADCPPGSHLEVDGRSCCGSCVPDNNCAQFACPMYACANDYQTYCAPGACCCECAPICDASAGGVRCTPEGPICIVGLTDATAADAEAGLATGPDSNGCYEWNENQRCSEEVPFVTCRSELPDDATVIDQTLTRLNLAGLSTVNLDAEVEQRYSSETEAGSPVQCVEVTVHVWRVCGTEAAGNGYVAPGECGSTCDPAASNTEVQTDIEEAQARMLALSPDSTNSAMMLCATISLLVAVLALAL